VADVGADNHVVVVDAPVDLVVEGTTDPGSTSRPPLSS
jgi:hypothetical protein